MPGTKEQDIEKIQYEIRYLKSHLEYEIEKVICLENELKNIEERKKKDLEHLKDLEFRSHDYKCRLEELKKEIPNFSEETYKKYREFIRVEDAITDINIMTSDLTKEKNYRSEKLKEVIATKKEHIEELEYKLDKMNSLMRKTKED